MLQMYDIFPHWNTLATANECAHHNVVERNKIEIPISLLLRTSIIRRRRFAAAPSQCAS